MKRVLVTGAGGFVGQALVQRLLLQPGLEQLVAVDRQLDAHALPWLRDPRVRAVVGDFAAPATLQHALAQPPDGVFHLASLPGSRAEALPDGGMAVNLLATAALWQRLAALPGPPARAVFASSIAVYGALPFEQAMHEDQPTRPLLSYGAHKRMAEILLADLSRRGGIDGLSLRLPGIVARPPSPTGHGSAFMSDLLHRLSAGEAYVCPVGPDARAWWMSLACCVDNLVHAAAIPPARLAPARVVQLPALTATVGEVVQAIAQRHGARAGRVDYRPDAQTEQHFGRFPVLHAPQAEALGFRHDGGLDALLRRVVP